MLTFLFAIMIAKLILKGKLQNMEVSTSPITLFTIIFILLLAALFTLLEYSLIKVRPTELKELKQTSSVRRAENMIGLVRPTSLNCWKKSISSLNQWPMISVRSSGFCCLLSCTRSLPTWFLKTWQLTSQLRFCWRLPTQ